MHVVYHWMLVENYSTCELAGALVLSPQHCDVLEVETRPPMSASISPCSCQTAQTSQLEDTTIATIVDLEYLSKIVSKIENFH
jgi:hypothetical protein